MSQPLPHSIKHALDPTARSPRGHKLTPKYHAFDQIIDLMLSDSSISLKEIGARLGRSQVWVSYVVHSDAFRDLYEVRRLAQNSVVHREVAESLARVSKKALANLEDVFDKNPARVTPQLALDVASMGLEKLGYGVKLPGVALNQVSVNVVSAEDFRHAQSIVRSVSAEVSTPLAGSPNQPSLSPEPAARITQHSISLHEGRAHNTEPELDDILASLSPPKAAASEIESEDGDIIIAGD